ncbi:zinc-binding protein A33-like [Salminus brasiliensis]|uniref:zinc-binding protein A33-like n=1 Tax=Salminus brasiliensis TaxID=930266 RepID=UPI003B834D8A
MRYPARPNNAEELRATIRATWALITPEHHCGETKAQAELLNFQLFLQSETSPEDLQRISEELTPFSQSWLPPAVSCLKSSSSEIELKQIQQCAVDVTLDPDTAHPALILSDDGKQVKEDDAEKNLPDNPERFDKCTSVLGKEGFSSGRFYYEVQVRGKTEWDLGVTSKSSNRKGEITARPENGYWIVCLRNETEYVAAESYPVRLSLKQAPQKVGVFVDYEEGLVSFYDVEVRSHIYSFTGQSFTEKLYPYFSPSLNFGGVNSAPLIITSVEN